jgi:hypothetical protein
MDRGPNRAYEGENHSWLNIPYNVIYCCFTKHVGEHIGNLKEHHENLLGIIK